MKQNKLNLKIRKALTCFTLSRILAALFTITIVATFKYLISGTFHIDYSEFITNVGVGLIGWTVNTGIMAWLPEYLDTHGIKFNLKELFFGLDTMNLGSESSSFRLEKAKPKLYNSMESDGDSDPSQPLDKGKGVDPYYHPNHPSLNKNKGVVSEGFLPDAAESSTLDKGKGLVPSSQTEPPFALWSRVFPDKDPALTFFPNKINPGPGFNVPGGKVPLHDDICKHIDYNSHILSQFKNMDWNTAIEQRNNYLKLTEVLKTKLDYAQDVLSKIPTIPTTEYEFRLKNRVLSDIEGLNNSKIRSEAKATLLTSRLEFIEIQLNNNNNNSNK